MQSFPGSPARSLFAARIHPAFATKIHPALTSLTDEVCATFARLFAYMGTLALLGILTIHAWDQLQLLLADEAAAKPSWSPADRSYPAFAVGGADSREKSASYTILRHPEGGRKDILRWTGQDGNVVAELEIYRPGGEFDPRLVPGSRRGWTELWAWRQRARSTASSVLSHCFARQARPIRASPSSCATTIRLCKSRGFRASATACRHAAPLLAACWIA